MGIMAVRTPVPRENGAVRGLGLGNFPLNVRVALETEFLDWGVQHIGIVRRVRRVAHRAPLFLDRLVDGLGGQQPLLLAAVTQEAVFLARAAEQQKPVIALMWLMTRRALPSRKRSVQMGLPLDLVAALTGQLRARSGHQKLRIRSVRIVARQAALFGNHFVQVFLMPRHRVTESTAFRPLAFQWEFVVRLFGQVTCVAGTYVHRIMPVRNLEHFPMTVGRQAIVRGRP